MLFNRHNNPILQMRDVKYEEVKCFVQEHAAGKWQNGIEALAVWLSASVECDGKGRRGHKLYHSFQKLGYKNEQ